MDGPKASDIAIRGAGDPNSEGGEYRRAMSVLYSVACTLRMSCRSNRRIGGFYDSPLGGFRRQDGVDGIDYPDKSTFRRISVIRLPEFITEADPEKAKRPASEKKKPDCSKEEFLTINEGLCVQLLRIGSYDDEPASVARTDRYPAENGYENDFGSGWLRHGICLSDARRVARDKLKTVIRHPVKRAGKQGTV